MMLTLPASNGRAGIAVIPVHHGVVQGFADGGNGNFVGSGALHVGALEPAALDFHLVVPAEQDHQPVAGVLPALLGLDQLKAAHLLPVQRFAGLPEGLLQGAQVQLFQVAFPGWQRSCTREAI